jgi:hypothetical protein
MRMVFSMNDLVLVLSFALPVPGRVSRGGAPWALSKVSCFATGDTVFHTRGRGDRALRISLWRPI